MTGGFIFIWTITTSGLDFHKVQSHLPLNYLNLKVTRLAPHWTWFSEQEPFHKILARPSHMEIERWPPLPLKICTNPRQGCEGRIWQQCWYKQPLILATYISIVCCFVIWPHWVVVVIPLFSVSYHSSAFATKLGEGWRQNWKYRFGWNCQYDFQNAHGITKSLEQNITGLTSTLSMCGKCLRQDKVCFIWKKEIMFGTFWTNPPQKHFRLLTFQLFPSRLNLKYRWWKIWPLMDTSQECETALIYNIKLSFQTMCFLSSF